MAKLILFDGLPGSAGGGRTRQDNSVGYLLSSVAPSTLLIWLYDEHGGYFDHVAPPPAEPPDDVPGIGSFDRYLMLRLLRHTAMGSTQRKQTLARRPMTASDSGCPPSSCRPMPGRHS